jgi:hypothetical protein
LEKLTSLGKLLLQAEAFLRSPAQCRIYEGQGRDIYELLAETTAAIRGPKFWAAVGVKGPQCKAYFPSNTTDLEVAETELAYKKNIIQDALSYAKGQQAHATDLDELTEEDLADANINLLPVEEEHVRRRLAERGQTETREAQEGGLKGGREGRQERPGWLELGQGQEGSGRKARRRRGGERGEEGEARGGASKERQGHRDGAGHLLADRCH